MLREHVTRQSLKPYWQWRSYSYFNVTWTFYLHNTVATNRQYLALSKALQSISLSSNFLHACIDSDTYLHIYFLCLQVSRQVQPYTSDLWHPTVYRHVSFITFTLLSGKISTVNYERQQLSTQSLNVSAQPLPLAVLNCWDKRKDMLIKVYCDISQQTVDSVRIKQTFAEDRQRWTLYFFWWPHEHRYNYCLRWQIWLKFGIPIASRWCIADLEFY